MPSPLFLPVLYPGQAALLQHQRYALCAVVCSRTVTVAFVHMRDDKAQWWTAGNGRKAVHKRPRSSAESLCLEFTKRACGAQLKTPSDHHQTAGTKKEQDKSRGSQGPLGR